MRRLPTSEAFFIDSFVHTINFDTLLIAFRLFVQFFVRIFAENFSMVATNISDFRSNIRQYVDQVLNDGSAVIINRGNTAAVLISLEEYNSIRATEDLISTGTTPAEVENGIAAFTSGSCIPVNIDEL